MKTAAIIPVKTFSNAKTRLDLPRHTIRKLCKIMLEEIIRTISASPWIDRTVIVTMEPEAAVIAGRFDSVIIRDNEDGVNAAVALADAYLLENGFDASIVFPQDIPYIKAPDIDFMLNYMAPPNFAVIVPSRRFDGTNAFMRMPVNLMETHYDNDSYRAHMNTAKAHTLNTAMIFVKRIMWDVDTVEDLRFLLEHDEKPHIAEKIRKILPA